MSLKTIVDGNARWYIIQTQNLEEYGTNFHKFKGGSEYCVYFEVTQEPWDDEYMYEVPSLTEASVAALVMKHVNRYNGLRGSFDYITDIKVVDSPFDTPDHPTWRGTEEDLIFEIENKGSLSVNKECA